MNHKLIRAGLLCFTLFSTVAILAGVHQSAKAQNAIAAQSCNKTRIYDASTLGSTQMVAAGGLIHVCGFIINAAAAANVKFVYGTGTNCATSPVNLTPAFQLAIGGKIEDGSPVFRGISVPPGQALCINSSAAAAVQALLYYTQQ